MAKATDAHARGVRYSGNTAESRVELLAPTDQKLNEVADKVTSEEVGSAYIQNVINRMLELSAGKGHSKSDTRQMVGLAAPQLGFGKRIITIDLTADGSNKEQHLLVVINPQITRYSKENITGREGCWSCGNICGIVERAIEVTLEGIDRGGKPVKIRLSGFVARIAQHEVDHLEGIRFPDRIPEDRPKNLHWVKPEAFSEYRLHWSTWPVKCPRGVWLAMKAGSSSLEVSKGIARKQTKSSE